MRELVELRLPIAPQSFQRLRVLGHAFVTVLHRAMHLGTILLVQAVPEGGKVGNPKGVDLPILHCAVVKFVDKT